MDCYEHKILQVESGKSKKSQLEKKLVQAKLGFEGWYVSEVLYAGGSATVILERKLEDERRR